jgi:hypothetical protein
MKAETSCNDWRGSLSSCLYETDGVSFWGGYEGVARVFGRERNLEVKDFLLAAWLRLASG